MRMVRIFDGVLIPVSSEEYEFIEFVDGETDRPKWDDLSERGQVVAFNLIRKNVLKKIEETDELVYNRYVDLWRM